MNERDDLELLMARTEQVREAQRNYFKHKTDVWKRKAIAMEGTLDEVLKQLRRKGYDPDRFKKQQPDNKLF
jgi:hypothetical protein